MDQPTFVQEPGRSVPVACDADVAVAGAGISGLFAALAAARHGARTVLIDRFGTVGGNIGGAGMFMACNGPDLTGNAKGSLPPGGRLPGVAGELDARVQALLGDMPRNNSTISLAVSRVGLEMLQEEGVTLLLSAYIADPIVEEGFVRGLYVETKSGRVAVRARVTIDATGDADLAVRAGAPTLWPIPASRLDYPWCWEFVKLPEYEGWNDGGMGYLIADVDWDTYQAFLATDVELTPEDMAWRDKLFMRNEGHMWEEGGRIRYRGKIPKVLFPLLRRAWEAGEYFVEVAVRPRVHVYPCLWWQNPLSDGLVQGRMQVSGDFDMGDWRDVAQMEAAARKCIFDMVHFFRRRVPGYESAWPVSEAALLGMRGGRCIEGEHTVTMEEYIHGLEADDVLFATPCGKYRRPEHIHRDYMDMPYRMLQPMGLDGLLVAGRGAAFIRRGHDPSIRGRGTMILLGQAAGIAAALATRDGVPPKRLDVKKLQRALLKEGFFLGGEERLKALGLPTEGVVFPPDLSIRPGDHPNVAGWERNAAPPSVRRRKSASGW